MDNLYDVIISEFNNKSIVALLWLLENGRELTFKYDDTEYSITREEEKFYLDCENENKIYDSAWQLLDDAMITNKKLIDIWNNVELENLY